ncbi:MAG: hypothetical protein K2H70_00710, partial [Bacteroidales bacterium]|nr:hypothetical protein [Bacteroidales bacterium]
STTYRFSPQAYPKQSVKSGGSVPMLELPVIKGSRAHLDIYRNGHLLDGQGYTIADNQLYFEEIGNYKLVVWHDSVRERKYGYDENGDWVKMNEPYGDTTFLTVYGDYAYGHDLARWTWEKEKSDYTTWVDLWFAGTAGEAFVMDWGDGERTVVEGTGESIRYTHAYDTAARQVEWRLYGATPEARILKLEKQYRVFNEKLDVSACPALTHLTWHGEGWATSGLAALDVSACKALTYLDCESNRLTSLDVSKNLALEELNCESNLLTSLDVSKNLALEELNCKNNLLTSLDVSKNAALTGLICKRNDLRTLDVSHNVALRVLDCGGCHLTALDVSKNVNLEELYCEYDQLKSLDVSGNLALKVLLCYGNYLPSLDISR